MHPENIIKNYEIFCKEIEEDIVRTRRAAVIYKFIDALIKLPLILLSSTVVLISSINISSDSNVDTFHVCDPTLNITILVLNAVMACLTGIYMYICPASRASKADICVAHLGELSNDVHISINELSVGSILSDLESDSSIGSEREMYQHYLVSMTRYSMKKMIIDENSPVLLSRRRSLTH
jgi:hypothetical protein